MDRRLGRPVATYEVLWPFRENIRLLYLRWPLATTGRGTFSTMRLDERGTRSATRRRLH